MQEDDTYIPRMINSGAVIFVWNADSFTIATIVFIIFAMLGSVVVAAILAYLAVQGWVKLKEEDGAGLVIRLLYWFLWSGFMVRDNAPVSEVKEYIG